MDKKSTKITQTDVVIWLLIQAINALVVQHPLTVLTPKHRDTHGCVVSTVATDALVLKHQAISIHNAD